MCDTAVLGTVDFNAGADSFSSSKIKEQLRLALAPQNCWMYVAQHWLIYFVIPQGEKMVSAPQLLQPVLDIETT